MLRISRRVLAATFILIVLARAACAPAPTPTQTPTATPTPVPPTPTPTPIPTYTPAWAHSDLRALDPWGDPPTHSDDAHDLVALYLKDSPPGEPLRFRLDVLDMKADAPVNAYLGLNWTDGGARALAPGGPPTTDLDWDLLLVLPADGPAVAYPPDFTPYPDAVTDSARDTILDYLTVTLDPSALPNPPTTPFQMQALLAPSGDSPTDRSALVASDAIPPEPAIMTMVFGDVMGGVTPGGSVFEYDRQDEDRDGTTRNWGLRYLLDAVEKYGLPISLRFKQVTFLPGQAYAGDILDRVRRLAKEGLLALPDETAYGHFMAWQPQDVDARAIGIARQLHRQLDLPPSPVFIPYETRVTLADLETIRQAGYRAIITTDEQKFILELEWPESLLVGRKLHRINGVLFLFFTPGWVGDERWGEVDWETWDSYEWWRGTDGGLHPWRRRILLDMALDPDREQFYGFPAFDWTNTSWGFEGVADANLRWIVEHPWIRVVTAEDLLDMGWTPIEHGDLGLAPEDHLHRFPIQGEINYNSYFQWFYHGGISDGRDPTVPAGQAIEAYADYVPYLRDGWPIPSGMRMGDDATPGTIIYETLAALRSAPDNPLTTLAWLAYFAAIGEQTLHAPKQVQPHDPEFDWWGDLGGAYLHPMAKMRANQLGQVNKLVAAALWAEDVASGQVSEQPQALAQDLDVDGENEFVLQNDRLFLILENDGGRLEYAFAYDPATGPIQFVASKDQFYSISLTQGINWDWTHGEANQAPTAPAWAGAFVEVHPDGASEQTYWQTYASLDEYAVEIGADTLTFTSPDGGVIKIFSLNGAQVVAEYTTQAEITVESSLVLDPLCMWTRGWDEKMEVIEQEGVLGVRYQDGPSLRLQVRGNGLMTPFPGGSTSFLLASELFKKTLRHPTEEEILRYELFGGNWDPFPFTTLRASGQGRFTLVLEFRAGP